MKRLRILLLGRNGQLGWEAERQLFCYGDVYAYDYPQIDFIKPETVLSRIDEIKPDIIYNAVAYTNVDKAEQEPNITALINPETPDDRRKMQEEKNSISSHIYRLCF